MASTWWNRRSREKEAQKMVRLPSLAGKIPTLTDPQCVACYMQNDSAVRLQFVSALEKVYPFLIEAVAFKEFWLEPGEKKLVPHTYFEMFPLNVERKVTRIGLGYDHAPVEFVYEMRAIEKDSSCEDPRSQERGPDTPPSGA
jgi:hypothetical protein